MENEIIVITKFVVGNQMVGDSKTIVKKFDINTPIGKVVEWFKNNGYKENDYIISPKQFLDE